jgi:prepilin-type N-terminal cleavage/methylation domain-containing protein
MIDFMFCRIIKPCSKQSGFTLIEMILAMVLLGIAAVMVTPFVGNILSNLLEGRQLVQKENQAAMALERFVREIRVAENEIVRVIENGKKILKSDDETLFTIDSNMLYSGEQADHVLVKHLADESDFKITESPKGGYDDGGYNIITLILKIKIEEEDDILSLSASAVRRKDLE